MPMTSYGFSCNRTCAMRVRLAPGCRRSTGRADMKCPSMFVRCTGPLSWQISAAKWSAGYRSKLRRSVRVEFLAWELGTSYGPRGCTRRCCGRPKNASAVIAKPSQELSVTLQVRYDIDYTSDIIRWTIASTFYKYTSIHIFVYL